MASITQSSRVLNIDDPETANSVSPTAVNVDGDTVEADPTNNIAAIARKWAKSNIWEVRIYFATRSRMLSELIWNSRDNVYKFGKLNTKKYEIVEKSSISAESQATEFPDAAIYVYCNLKKYNTDFNVVYLNGSSWNDRDMS
ncbi:hypothetical protein MY8738_009015 [Beauveria namnaoensis]